MGGEAKSRMDRIIRLHEEIDSIKADIREIYAEEKADGGDKTAMGTAISIIRKREKDRTAFDDREAMVDVYLNAYASPSHTHAREASQSYAEAKGVDRPAQKIEKGLKEALAVAKGEAEPAHWHHVTDTQEQPEEPASQSDQASEVRTDALRSSDAGKLDHDWNAPAESASDEISAPIPPSAVTPLPADKTGAAPLPSNAAPVAPFDNPRCLNACHLAHSKDACHDCLIAWSARPKDEQVRLWAEANATVAA